MVVVGCMSTYCLSKGGHAVPYLPPAGFRFYNLAMEIFVETLTGTVFELRVSPFETIMSVKAKIQRIEGMGSSEKWK